MANDRGHELGASVTWYFNFSEKLVTKYIIERYLEECVIYF